MLHTLYNNDNIICANFEKDGNLSISIFNLENFSNNLTFTYFINIYSQNDIFNLIIEISKDNSKALICYYNVIDLYINCLIFNIYNNSVEEVYRYMNYNLLAIYNFNINFLKIFHSINTKEYIITAIEYLTPNYIIVKLDENFISYNYLNGSFNIDNYYDIFYY